MIWKFKKVSERKMYSGGQAGRSDMMGGRDRAASADGGADSGSEGNESDDDTQYNYTDQQGYVPAL